MCIRDSPYTVTEIETYAKPSAWHILVMGLAIPGIFLFLIGFCSLIRLLLSTSTTVSIMFHSFTSAFKAGYESVEKGKNIHISDYKMICTLPTDLLEKT